MVVWTAAAQHSDEPVLYAAHETIVHGYHVGRSFTGEAFTPSKVLTCETPGQIKGLAFDPDEGTLVVAVTPLLLVLDALTGTIVDREQEHDDLFLIDIVPPKRLLVTTGGGCLRTWRIVPGGRLQPVSRFGGLDTRSMVASCAEGHYTKILVGCGDGVLRTWHTKQGELEEPLDAALLPHFSGFGVMCVRLYWRELLVVTGSQDSLCSWRVAPSGALELLHEVEGAHERGVLRVCFDESFRLHTTSGMDGNIRTWRIASGGEPEVQHTLKPPSGTVFFMHMLNEPRRLLTNSLRSNEFCVWEIRESGDFTLVGEDRTLASIPACVHVHPSEQFLLVGYTDGCLRSWGLAASGAMKVLSANEGAHQSSVLGGLQCGTTCMDFLQPQRLLLTGGGDAALRSWSVDTSGSFKLQAEVKDAHGKCVNCLCYIEPKRLLITGGFDKHVRTWSLADGSGALTRLYDVEDHSTGFCGTNALEFIPAKQILVTGGGDDSVRIWHANQADEGGELELLQAIEHGHEYGMNYVGSVIAQMISGKSSQQVLLTGGNQGDSAHVSIWSIGDQGVLEKMADVGARSAPCVYLAPGQLAMPLIISGGRGCTAWHLQHAGNFEETWFPQVSATSVKLIVAGSWGSSGDFLWVGTANGHLFGLSFNALLKQGVVRLVRTDQGLLDAVKAWWFPFLNYGVAAANSAVAFVQLLSFGFSAARPPRLEKPAQKLATFRDLGFDDIPYRAVFIAAVVLVFFMVFSVGISQKMKRWASLNPDTKIIGYMFLAMSAYTQACASAGFLPILRPLLRSTACAGSFLQVDQSVQCGSVAHLLHWVLPGWVSAALLCFQAARLARVDYALPKLKRGRHPFDWRADIVAQEGANPRTHPLVSRSSSHDARALLGKLVLTLATIYVPTLSLSRAQAELLMAVAVFAVGIGLLRSSWTLDQFFESEAGPAALALPWGLQANALGTMAAAGVTWVSATQLAAATAVCIRGHSVLEHPIFIALPAMIPLPMALGYFARARKASWSLRRVADKEYQALKP